MFFESFLSLLLASSLHLGSPAVLAEVPFDQSVLLSVSSVPAIRTDVVRPELSGESVFAVDLESKSVLYEKNASERRPIASLTKLMTAYIILNENDPGTVVMVSPNAAATGGSTMGLYAYEKITIKDLLYGLLIVSGNDAAVTLAEYNAGSAAAFVEKMNKTAAEMGLTDTFYADVAGLEGSTAYSTARDLTVLSTSLLGKSGVREIVNQKSVTVVSVSGQTHKLISTNILLGTLGIKGLKTGKTSLAGECLVALAESSGGASGEADVAGAVGAPHEFLTVVLGSEYRFVDTKVLVNFIQKNFIW
ncbi:MAG: serine hydrolase [Candidatus Gracilibacteria bacterium]|jgi:D-alanyl-D-alanine carboxypeptidase (penicillin-binding protein 5/6)